MSAGQPVILAVDFSREEWRFAALSRIYPRLTWAPDTIAPLESRERIEAMGGVSVWDHAGLLHVDGGLAIL